MAIQPADSRETIVVVDDQAAIRRMVSRILVAQGFRVFEASDTVEAAALVDRTERPCLLISDVLLPDENGPALMRRLRARHPELPVLFMSGSTDDVLAGELAGLHGAAFIAKPFTADALVSLVRRLFAVGG